MKLRETLVALLLILTLLSATAVFPTPATATGSGDYPPPTDGDWTITTDTTVENETIILNGNLTVENGATLTFRNVTLLINSTDSQYYAIEVLDGATFRILDVDNDNTTTGDASVIERNNSSNPYFFRAYDGSVFEMRNSELHGCGDATTVSRYAGLYIETDNAVIDHNLISNNYYGIVLYGSDARVSNNTITWNDDTGIYAGYWSNGTIENNWITYSGTYGIVITGGGSTGTKPSNPTVVRNTIADSGQGSPGGVGVQILYGSKPLIKDTLILRSTEDALYSDSSTPTIMDVTIDSGGVGNYGIVGSSTGYLYIINSSIMNTKVADLAILDSYFIITNSSFNESKISINSGSNYTVRWYLHVHVEDSEHNGVSSAAVRVRDNDNGSYDENFTTDVNGDLKWIVVKEYWANKTTKIYYTPYNITVNYTGLTFIDNPRNSTVNESKTEVFRATTPVPEFPNVLIAVMISLIASLHFLRKKGLNR